MPRFEIRAEIVAPRILAAKIPQSLQIELRKRKYARFGVELLHVQITELRE